jgi:hypothetical protein
MLSQRVHVTTRTTRSTVLNCSAPVAYITRLPAVAYLVQVYRTVPLEARLLTYLLLLLSGLLDSRRETKHTIHTLKLSGNLGART